MPVPAPGRHTRRATAAALCFALTVSASLSAPVTAAVAAPLSTAEKPAPLGSLPVAEQPSLAAPAAAAAPAIVGTVVSDRSGDPLAGVSVTAYRADASGGWNAVAWAETSPTGAYSLTGLTAGAYRVGATDWSGRHADGFYSGAATLAAATDIVYTGTTVPAVSLRLTRDPIVRVYGADRFSSAVEMVYEQYADSARGVVDFSDVTTVVLASGDDRSAADPLAAAGLCYAYQVTDPDSTNAEKGAPLVLVPGAGTVPLSVRQLVADIACGDSAAGITGNGAGTLRLLVVGGTRTLPDAQVSAIESFARSKGASVTTERVAGTDRYDVAARIAARMRSAADADSGDSIERPTRALLANGADARAFFDALSLSPIAAHAGSPVLLVSSKAVPAATTRTITSLGLTGSQLWVAGGTATVTDGVLDRLGVPRAQRLAGANRYATATAVAQRALASGWLPDTDEGDARGVVVASTLADALAGGAFAGDAGFGYPLLLVTPTGVPADTARFLSANGAGIRDAVVLGGPGSTGAGCISGVRAALR